MDIILSRHGNTFAPSDPVVWTGSSNDLPLVAEGIAQAEKFGRVLLSQGLRPAAVYCGPLKRTRVYAEILIGMLGLSEGPRVDSRLNEIDYGKWTGLTQDQVEAEFGPASLKAWNEKSVWPKEGGWGGSPEKIISEVHSFVHDLQKAHRQSDLVLVISSNGRLRYFLTLQEGVYESHIKTGRFKVKTGNICKLKASKESVVIDYWNIDPNSLDHS